MSTLIGIGRQLPQPVSKACFVKDMELPSVEIRKTESVKKKETDLKWKMKEVTTIVRQIIHHKMPEKNCAVTNINSSYKQNRTV